MPRAREVMIHVFQNSDAQVVLAVKKDGQPYPFGNEQIEFYAKATRKTDDVDAFAMLTRAAGRAIPNTPEAGDVTLEFAAAELVNAGHFFWRLDALPNGKRRPLLRGPFVIEDV